MEELSKNLDSIKIVEPNDKVYKEECVYSFDTPESPDGLYICLKTFLGLGKNYVEEYYERTKHSTYLHVKRDKKEIKSEQPGDGPAKKITRLAIGTPGGFSVDSPKYTFEETRKIVILPTFATIEYPRDDLPEKVKKCVQSVIGAESATKVAEMQGLAGTWDGEAKVVSKHAANLLQLENGRKIPPSGWKCDKCDLSQNLWLNLTDGTILCGRKFYDGTGGNDHAVEHYRATGHPLAVKLGTITKEGKGDVFSYDEDDMVDDPQLMQHLAHWGINIAQMKKTDKSMIELELDLNQKLGEWSALQEASSKLAPIYGPGYTGLANLGNSCYLNSVMQTIFVIPDFVKRYVDAAPQIFHENVSDPANDFNVQMAKLGDGLLSGRYSIAPTAAAAAATAADATTATETESSEDEGRQGISPRMFKVLIGRGNSTFASNRQQDAQEFLLHLMNVIDRHSVNQSNPTECFKFKVEERYECDGSKKVKYCDRPEYLLPLSIPLDAATNKDEVAAYEAEKKELEAKGQRGESIPMVRPHIKLVSCLESLARSETVEQFYSTALNEKTTATKITRLATFPDYLLIHLKKFTMRDDWRCIKLDVAVEMPDILDLTWLRAGGLQPNEELLPESEPPPPVYDQEILSELTKMGFPPEACKRALYLTGNKSLGAALNWALEHICDSDFANPFVPPGTDVKPSSKNTFVPAAASMEYLSSLGFTDAQATKALEATDNNVERAVDWIFSHQDDDPTVSAPMEQDSPPKTSGNSFRDGNGHYKLVGFISHMGTSTMVGHYVCHLLKDNRWIIYNDEKVALSENPPKELGYIYMYKRLEASPAGE